MDRGDYSLSFPVFSLLLHASKQWVVPNIDMFASPGNARFPRFACRFPHWQAELVDAMSCNLSQVRDCYANPPWTIIHLWLNRLVDHPKVTCLMITPFWVSALWFPLLLRLRKKDSPTWLLPPRWGLFTDCSGIAIPSQGGPFSARCCQRVVTTTSHVQ
jgi:hypothetical protein